VILGSEKLREYLINFCRPFIYSTAMPPASVAAIRAAYAVFPSMSSERNVLKNLISLFDHPRFKKSDTPVQCFVIPGNERVKEMANLLLKNNFDARPILYPTVPLGEERLRIALHSFNRMGDVQNLISILTG
jgi:8-amino-7-oxononanoate synthase